MRVFGAPTKFQSWTSRTIPSICDERIELYLARGLSHRTTSHEADEIIRVEWIELARVSSMIRAGEVVDAKTIAGVFHAQAFLAAGDFK